MSRVRWVEVVRAGWGLSLLAAPDYVLSHVHHIQIDQRSRVVARILGARHLAQAALSGVSPSPEILAMGVWVDAVHAASAVGLAALDRPRVRAGATDALIAGSFAATGWHDLARTPGAPGGHDRRRDRLARLVLRLLPGGKGLLARARRDR